MLGWTVERGSRATDLYFLPPGIHTRAGYACRVDYFDSRKQVLEVVRNSAQHAELAAELPERPPQHKAEATNNGRAESEPFELVLLLTVKCR